MTLPAYPGDSGDEGIERIKPTARSRGVPGHEWLPNHWKQLDSANAEAWQSAFARLDLTSRPSCGRQTKLRYGILSGHACARLNAPRSC